MADSLGGFSRIPNANRDPRVRRQSANLASDAQWIDDASVISIVDGILVVTLDADGGLVNTVGELGIKLNGNELALSTDGLTIAQRHEFRRTAELAVAKQESMAYTSALHSEALAFAFFQGQM
jgi:hypothetical protein